MDFIINDNYHTLTKGDILIIIPNQVHAAVVKNPTEYERFYILLPIHSLDCFISNPLLDFLNNKNSSSKITLPESQKEKILSLLYTISHLCSEDITETSNFKIISLIMEFLCIIKEGKYTSQVKALKETVYIPTIIKDVLNYIGNNTVNITSVNDIANHFNISLPIITFQKMCWCNHNQLFKNQTPCH